MWKSIKLFINLLITSIVFNYFITILILLLNPQISLTIKDFFILYFDLFIFYGSLWFIFTGIIFFITQFFSEKKYQIGILSPPTITYFLSFTIFIISFILYFNYDYYFDFFPGNIKFKFLKILLINLILIITGILFLTIKKINKKWIQTFFLIILLYNIVICYNSVIYNNNSSLDNIDKKKFSQEVIPRKIRIVIMDGLSSNFILSLSSEQKLLNFKYLINNGVRGRITTFKPNLNLSLLNSGLTGLKPSEFNLHSNYKFKFPDLEYEFNIFPRYIFFRYSSNFKFTLFYKTNNDRVIDNIKKYYETNNYKTIQIINPFYVPMYSKKSLYKNNLFIHLYSDIINKDNPKHEILKKSFFFDDYLKNRIPELKNSNIFYSTIRMPGLGTISKYFYQYYMNYLFPNIPEKEIKKYKWIIEKYYKYYDSIIGNLISTTGENELLVILSFSEYEPLPVWRRILLNLFARKDIYVYKSLNSKGTIFLYEKSALKKDYPLKNISIFDIFPTLLYYSRFQLSKNLHGEVIKEIFTDEFLLNNPIDINTNYR